MSLPDQNTRSIFFVFIPVLIFALVLQIIRLPESIDVNRPNIIILVLIFFGLINPKRINVEFAWLVGLILDLLTGAPLGINAFLLATQIYLITSQFKRFPQYAVWQQSFIICMVNVVVNVIGYWFEHIIGQGTYDLNVWIPSVVLGVLWPIVYFLLLITCRSFSVPVTNEKSD